MTKQKLKVFGGCFDGTRRMIVAATSKKAAAEAFKVSLYSFNEFGDETGNDEECKTALAEPGVAFHRSVDGRGPFARGLRP